MASSGTSTRYSASCCPRRTCQPIRPPVATVTRVTVRTADPSRHRRKPYITVRLIQMIRNGTVCQPEIRRMAMRLSTMKITQATSTQATRLRFGTRMRRARPVPAPASDRTTPASARGLPMFRPCSSAHHSVGLQPFARLADRPGNRGLHAWFEGQSSQTSSLCQASRPSHMAKDVTVRTATGPAHHQLRR